MLNSIKTITALITPFKDGRVDYVSFRRLLKYQAEKGVKGFVINGTTGESPCLEEREVRTLFEVARGELGHSCVLLVGVGLNSTDKTIEWAKKVQDWKPEGLLVVTPYYNKPPQRGLVMHFQKVAGSVSLPLVLYNVPQRTGVSLSMESIGFLSQEKNIIGIKEASGDVEFGEEILKFTEDFILLSGDDSSCLELTLKGGSGVISVLSHLLPDLLDQLLKRASRGEREVLEDYKKYSQLIRYLYIESNPIGVKAALSLMGIIDSSEMRGPLVSLSDNYEKKLKEILLSLGLL